MDDILTLKELADYLKISEKTLYGYAQKGKLPGIKIGAAWRFRKTDIDDWLEEQRQITEASSSGRNSGRKKPEPPPNREGA